MNWDALSAIAELVAAGGVILSLIYLANQIRTNSKLVRAQITKDLFVTANTKLLEIAASPELLKSASEFLDLDSGETLDTLLLHSVVRELELQFILRRQELLDPDTEGSYDGAVRAWLSSARSKEWWTNARDGFNQDFVRYVHNIVEEGV